MMTRNQYARRLNDILIIIDELDSNTPRAHASLKRRLEMARDHVAMVAIVTGLRPHLINPDEAGLGMLFEPEETKPDVDAGVPGAGATG